MNKPRFTRTALALVLACSLLAACGQAGGGAAPSGSPGASGTPLAAPSPTEISFSFWGNQEEIDNKLQLIAEFERQNPDLKVKPVYTDGGQYATKMQTWFSSGQTPDAMAIAADNIYDYVNAGMFESLTPYIQQDGLQNAWAESASQNFVYGGQQYGLPHVYHVYCLAYNKALFDQAGLAYPTADWTLADFTAAAGALTRGEGAEKVYGFGGYGAYAANEYAHAFGGQTYGWANGFEVFPKGTAQFIQGIEFFKGMIDAGTTPSPDSDAGDIGFDSGRFGMYVAAPWWISTWQAQNEFGWDLVPFPQVEGGAWTARVYPNGMAIPAASAHKDEAWRLIRWLCADPGAQQLASATGMPNLTAYATSEAYLNYLPEGWKPYNKLAFVDALEHTWMIQNTGAFDQINTLVLNEFPNYLSGRLSAEEYAALIQTKGEELEKPT